VTATVTSTDQADFKDLGQLVTAASVTSCTDQADFEDHPVNVVVGATVSLSVDRVDRHEPLLTTVAAAVSSTDQADFRQLGLPVGVTATVFTLDGFGTAIALTILVAAFVTSFDGKSRAGVVKLNDASAIYLNGWADAVYVGATKVWP